MKKSEVLAGGALIASLLIVGAALTGWKLLSLQAQAGEAAFELPEFVDVATAETTPWQPTSRLVGTVFAKRAVTLANEVVGVVTEVGFDSGEVVEAGQTLIVMDTSTERALLASAEAAVRYAVAAIDVAQAQIAAAESDLTLARNNKRRFEQAASDNSVSPTETDRINAEVEKAGANLDRDRAAKVRAVAERDQAEARAQEIRTLIAKKTLVAPFRARVGMRSVHPGQYLGEGTQIVELTELTDDIYVDFAVPQEHAARVKPGTVVIARSQTLGGDSVPITVVSIDAVANSTTRNVRIRSSVPNPNHTIKPGMFIDVEVPVEAARDAIAVPATAVRRAAFGNHVYVLVPGDPKTDPPGAMRAIQRIVSVGPDIGGRVILTSGLAAGEKVAASGSFKLREGALVFAAPPPADPSAPSDSPASH